MRLGLAMSDKDKTLTDIARYLKGVLNALPINIGKFHVFVSMPMLPTSSSGNAEYILKVLDDNGGGVYFVVFDTFKSLGSALSLVVTVLQVSENVNAVFPDFDVIGEPYLVKKETMRGDSA